MDYKELRELMMRNRSYRRFDEKCRVSDTDLREIIELCRYTASGRNLQPMKYRYVNSEEECDKIFPHLKWAGYLTDWDGPEEGERPSAYIVQCLDTALTRHPLCDDGIQLEAVTLGAVSKGLGCCIIKSFNKKEIEDILGLPETLEAIYVIAIGKAVEEVVIEDIVGEDIKYWRDKDKIHHVPKRRLEEILVK